MPKQRIGYRRVSTAIQKTDRQLAEVELDRVFTDRASGSTIERPELDRLLEHVRDGDEVHVHSIDRLARSLEHLINLVRTINDKGASVSFHKEGLTFSGEDNPLATLQLQMLASFAQFERALINERSAEGRAAAKAKGVRFGRPPALGDNEINEVRAQYAVGKTVSAIALDFDVSRQSVYRALGVEKR